MSMFGRVRRVNLAFLCGFGHQVPWAGNCNRITPWQQNALLFYSCVRLAKRSRPFSLPQQQLAVAVQLHSSCFGTRADSILVVQRVCIQDEVQLHPSRLIIRNKFIAVQVGMQIMSKVEKNV